MQRRHVHGACARGRLAAELSSRARQTCVPIDDEGGRAQRCLLIDDKDAGIAFRVADRDGSLAQVAREADRQILQRHQRGDAGGGQVREVGCKGGLQFSDSHGALACGNPPQHLRGSGRECLGGVNAVGVDVAQVGVLGDVDAIADTGADRAGWVDVGQDRICRQGQDADRAVATNRFARDLGCVGSQRLAVGNGEDVDVAQVGIGRNV